MSETQPQCQSCYLLAQDIAALEGEVLELRKLREAVEWFEKESNGSTNDWVNGKRLIRIWTMPPRMPDDPADIVCPEFSGSSLAEAVSRAKEGGDG